MIYQGNCTIIDRSKATPAIKSIILAGSFGIPPKNDLNNNSIPNIKKSCQGKETPAPNINNNPASISIAPNILTTIIFKTSIPLKN